MIIPQMSIDLLNEFWEKNTSKFSRSCDLDPYCKTKELSKENEAGFFFFFFAKN